MKGTSSDSFAAHFASLVPKGTEGKDVKNYVKVKVDIIWQGDPISCVKTFGSRGCKLCAKERYEILKLTRNNPRMAINKCNEVHGACRHKPRFHRFDQSQIATSTDESTKDERVTRPSSTTSVESGSSTNSIGSFSNRRESSMLHPDQVLTDYDMNGMNGLLARYHFDPGELPQVDSNLERPPQEDEDLVLAEGLTVDL